ncbi:hypothetical protein FQN55_006538 [Onygenales sp. PD_40]|nr:hypothetical protein FQN55_006538 [Onygenales sp. PD_40]KAK2778365.1 hypothetical protein FQN53_001824 [Emmonsiellopsis sp. PD_33]KAK2798107.1 hypothetical protein FQN51_007926 [Onygenales sp. PD_10]
MSFLPTINLPLPILTHALGLTVLGIYLTFTRSPAALGIATTGLGLGYLTTSYVPIEENQFVHASVPVRMVLALLAAARIPSASRQDQRALGMIAVYDLVGAIMVGYSLGRWDGRVSGY